MPTTSIATSLAVMTMLVAFWLGHRGLTLAQLTGQETLFRADFDLLELAKRTHTLGGAARTVKVRGGAPLRGAGGLSVRAMYVPASSPTSITCPRPTFDLAAF